LKWRASSWSIPPSWDGALHPAAQLFPKMSDDEIVVLGDDIKAHGLRQPIVFLNPKSGQGLLLLDGRNRIDAMKCARLSTTSLHDSWPQVKQNLLIGMRTSSFA
jgi:hypothetical protein